MVPPIEARHHIVKTSLDLLVRQRQDTLQDSRGARVLPIESFVPRNEEAGHHSRSVGDDVR
jgi:hypothetical protein